MRRLAAGGGAVALGSSLSGCIGGGDDANGSGSGGGGGGQASQELVLARAGDADSLDPHRSTLAYSSMVMQWIYDPLLTLDFEGNVHPGLGKEWEVSDDGLTWTIELHDDISFHNGDPLTAEDVAFTFNRATEISGWSWAFGPMEVEAVDEHTAEFTFDDPYYPWEFYSTGPSAFFEVIPQGPVEEDEDGFSSNPIGTGPYVFDEWVRDDHIRLVRNDEWNTPTIPEVTDDEPPLPEALVFRTIPEETPRLQALLQGDIDILISRDFPPREYETVENDGASRVERQMGLNTGYLTFNMQKEPTDDIRVRQALAHAVDRDRVINDIFHGLGTPNYVPFSEAIEHWAGDAVRDAGYGYEYDPERAEELLEEAGWVDNGGEFREKDGDELVVQLYSTDTPPPRLQFAEEMVDMFAQIGVHAELTPYEYGTANSVTSDGEANIFYATIEWSEASIVQFYWHSDNIGGGNRMFLDDPELDEMMEEATRQEDPAELYEEIQLHAMEQCPCKPIMTYDDVVGLSSSLQNYEQHPRTLTPLYHNVTKE
ncbi:ABC transporter substrate-binding protein (plasmid) [Haloferacaceae archaeon DSL9]